LLVATAAAKFGSFVLARAIASSSVMAGGEAGATVSAPGF
jgi:hypothetical protein